MTGYNTLDRIKKRLSKHLAVWVAVAMQRKLFCDGPTKSYEAVLAEDEDEMLTLGTETMRLHTWHFNHYAHSVLNSAS
jgi:hypothetical protein